MITYAQHATHGRWRKIGRCVYCFCGERLYQGGPPKTEEKQSEFAAAFDDLCEAARKKFKGTLENER